MASQCLCSSHPIVLSNGSKHRRSEAGDSDVLKRGHKVLPVSEKVCMYRNKQYISGSVLSVVSGTTWGCWNISTVDKGGLLERKVCIFPCLLQKA